MTFVANKVPVKRMAPPPNGKEKFVRVVQAGF